MEIDRKDLHTYQREMMETEKHHDHKVVLVGDTFRWQENEGVRELVDMCDLNIIIADMRSKGIGKNDERYRRLYRNMGYSLSGYWGIFYWEVNNPDASKYKPPEKEPK